MVKITEILFPESDLPSTLYTTKRDTAAPPCPLVRLIDDYSPENRYPLLVYVLGLHGVPKGNINNAQTIARTTGWIVVSLPLFKKF